MAKYVLTRTILGGEKPQQKGEVIELTDEQAAHPFYSNRVQPVHVAQEQETEVKPLKAPKAP